mgnify:CR=1 FL=1|jgi:hypothetical protein
MVCFLNKYLPVFNELRAGKYLVILLLLCVIIISFYRYKNLLKVFIQSYYDT